MSQSRVPVVYVNIQDDNVEEATLTFVNLLLQARETPPEPVRSPIVSSSRLDSIAARNQLFFPEITYWEPTVRRRINFDDPDDAEKEMKLAMFKLMIMTSKRKEELRIQEAESRKRKREEEVKPKEVVRRTKPVQTYAKKMRFI